MDLVLLKNIAIIALCLLGSGFGGFYSADFLSKNEEDLWLFRYCFGIITLLIFLLLLFPLSQFSNIDNIVYVFIGFIIIFLTYFSVEYVYFFIGENIEKQKKMYLFSYLTIGTTIYLLLETS